MGHNIGEQQHTSIQYLFAQAYHGRMEAWLGGIFKPGVPINVLVATITWKDHKAGHHQIPSSWDTN